MAHVTFIHGLANKPPQEDLVKIWRRALSDGTSPVSLRDRGITSSLVYWADVLYEKPIQDLADFESAAESTPEAIDAAGDASEPVAATPEEAAFVSGLRAKMTTMAVAEVATAGVATAVEEPKTPFERILLPWFIKKKFLDAYLRDLHHYMFDVEYAPPGRQPVRVQQTIRKRFLDALCSAEVSRPHIVVSHSMGTIIAYDCLKRVPTCSGVDGLITLGCPLGLDEVQDQLHPEWTREDGYPTDRLAGRWVNIYDRLDPVCGFDARIANDFRKGGTATIEDVEVHNDGHWRHSATKYLRQQSFREALTAMLG
jgi:hypothetical protein